MTDEPDSLTLRLLRRIDAKLVELASRGGGSADEMSYEAFANGVAQLFARRMFRHGRD
jgi:hypothetical protein